MLDECLNVIIEQKTTTMQGHISFFYEGRSGSNCDLYISRSNHFQFRDVITNDLGYN